MLRIEKAKYYPRVDVQEYITRFGAKETNCPDLYKTPVPSNSTSAIASIEVDALKVLEMYWGENILQNRDRVYKLVSGTCEDDDELRSIVGSLYNTYASFKNYVDRIVLFEPEGAPVMSLLIKPMREKINERIEAIEKKVEREGGKVVLESHDYVYATFRKTIAFDLVGMKVIKNV